MDLFIRFRGFGGDVVDFFIYIYDSCKKKRQFYFFFFNTNVFCFFSLYFIVLEVKPPIYILTINGKSRYVCLDPDFQENTFRISTLNMILAVAF